MSDANSLAVLAWPLQDWLEPHLQKMMVTRKLSEKDTTVLHGRSSEKMRDLLKPLMTKQYWEFVRQVEIGGVFALGTFLEMSSIVLLVAKPLLLQLTLQSPTWRNLLQLLGATALGGAVSSAQAQACRMQAGAVWPMLSAGIFEKSLKLSERAKLEYPAEKVLNIQNGDLNAVQTFCVKSHQIWSSGLRLLIVLVLLSRNLGLIPAVIAILVMFAQYQAQSKGGGLAAAANIEWDKYNDLRIRYIRDCLYSIKGVKALGFEARYMDMIDTVRTSQLQQSKIILRTFYVIMSVASQMNDILTAAVALCVYWMLGNSLTMDIVFPTIALFDMMNQPAGTFAAAVTRLTTIRRATDRILGFLHTEEQKDRAVSAPSSTSSNKTAVRFENATFLYAQGGTENNQASPFTLGPMTTIIPRNKLTMIVGPVGSGKSTLLNAVAGELRPQDPDSLQVDGTLALSAQDPWIRSGTVRDNITFMSDFDESRYRDTIGKCALERDLKQMQKGDGTVAGEKGANLSGGQRARVSLARAVYSQAEVLLLDDPLAAVDVHVGRHLFHECLRKLPQTVVLVTHQTSYMQYADHVIVLDKGRLVEQGPPGTISYAAATISSDASADQHPGKTSQVEVQANGTSKTEAGIEEAAVSREDEGVKDEADQGLNASGTSLFLFLCGYAGGNTFIVTTLLAFILSLVLRISASYYFVWWLGDRFALPQAIYMGGYLVVTLLQALGIGLLGQVIVSGCIRAEKSVHGAAIQSLLKSPLWYLESQQVGRLLHPFTADVESIDFNIVNALDGLFAAFGQMLASLLMVVISTPVVLFILAPLAYISQGVLAKYRVSALALRQATASFDSAAGAILNEALSGLPSIQAYGAHSFYLSQYDSALNHATVARIMRGALETWISTRAEFISSIVLFTSGSLLVSGYLPPSLAGLALSAAISSTKNVYLLLWAIVQTEVELASVDRLQETIERLPQESSVSSSDSSITDSWPSTGSIAFKNVTLTYHARPTQAALKNITLSFPAGSSTGIIGRTGSGKSSIVSTLSRLHEISDGSITVDGVDIRDIPLATLRAAIHVLPQEPVVFEGTLRNNIDPQHARSDEECWDALAACNLDSFFSSLKKQDGARPDALQTVLYPPSSPLSSLSAGQTALLTVARAILARPKVLLIDEATAAVDQESEEMIQKALRERFRGTTIVAVAHRLKGLKWMKRVVRMEAGMVERVGTWEEVVEG